MIDTVLRRLALAAAMFAAVPLAHAQTPTGCDVTAAPVPALTEKGPANLGVLKIALIRYRCADYDADVASVVAEARDWVTRRAPQVDRPAIVLDIDETSLSNWEQLYHNDFGYLLGGACDLKSSAGCGQRDWELSASATALKPTLELFLLAQRTKGRDGNAIAVFFITGRGEDPVERAATELNLRRAGYDGYSKLLMRPAGEATADFKTRMRSLIGGEHTVIANIGDQFSDLAGGHAERCFKLPNPFYFIPGGTIPEGGLECLRR